MRQLASPLIPFVFLAITVGGGAFPRTSHAAEYTVLSADRVPIRYSVAGEGEPTLIFVHCWSCNRHFWDEQVERFANRHRIVTNRSRTGDTA